MLGSTLAKETVMHRHVFPFITLSPDPLTNEEQTVFGGGRRTMEWYEMCDLTSGRDSLPQRKNLTGQSIWMDDGQCL